MPYIREYNKNIFLTGCNELPCEGILFVNKKRHKGLFATVLSAEIEEYQKLMTLTKTRKTLDIPSLVTSRQD